MERSQIPAGRNHLSLTHGIVSQHYPYKHMEAQIKPRCSQQVFEFQFDVQQAVWSPYVIPSVSTNQSPRESNLTYEQVFETSWKSVSFRIPTQVTVPAPNRSGRPSQFRFPTHSALFYARSIVAPSESSSGSGGDGGQGFVVTAASDSLGAGRERFDPAADETDPALHQLNRRRTATISTSLPPVRPISWIPSIHGTLKEELDASDLKRS
ncbi:hypothetical protein MUK42_01402 [Musa troglodytarum]|uniref:Uncharacterized protein n=1 Tax=Musa troglodytarum TaxID=320322 RepID=A0A9E7F8Q6_9LILI|nr:hypothetical protein MUK42_01402 [Musa troglodytarum]